MPDPLSELRNAAPANADLLADLERRLTAPHPIPLVPFVGAGLSKSMGFPSWPAFLTTLAKECGTSTQVADLLQRNAYEEAAELVEQAFGPTLFHNRVRHTFGKAKSDACVLKGAVLALPELAAGPVVTTNFDRVIERVFEEAGAAFEHVAWGSQVDHMRQALQENAPFLLKLHGDSEERTGRVLTRSEYDRHYGPTDPAGLRAQLARAFQGRTFLFIGCSLAADRTMTVLADVLEQASGLEHFALVERPDDDAVFFARQRWLSEHAILPIWYPNGAYELGEPFLRWLAGLQPSTRIREPELVLEAPERRKHKALRELDLLVPDQRITTLAGRDREIESLDRWLRSDAPVSIRVITGAGGSGKTRLAIEALDAIEATEPGRWHAGFLTTAEMERFSRQQNLASWKRRRPVFAVADYAAGSAQMLRLWLEQLASAAPGGGKLRLLLLEREASAEQGWLSSVLPQGHAASAVRALFDPPEPIRLEKIEGAALRRAVLTAALDAGARYRNAPPLRIPEVGADPHFDQRLEDPLWGDPLTLMMAAFTGLDTGLPAALARNRTDLAHGLAAREGERIATIEPRVPRRLLEHMAAYLTLAGDLPQDPLRQVAKAESEAIGLHHHDGWGALVDVVGNSLRPVQPDIIGEAFLLHVWGGSEIDEGCRAIVRAVDSRPEQVIASVIRCAQDFCVGSAPREEPLRWLDALIAEGQRKRPLLWMIETALPHQTLALRERAVEVDRALASMLDAADPASLEERGRILNNLGRRLSELGRREEALQAAEEAVRIRRQLAAQRPDAFLPDVAMSLDNLAVRLSELGRREEALQAAEEATELYRQLAAQRLDAFLPGLAMSPNNLGGRLSELGRREEALEAAEEAVRIRRQLAAQRPDAFLPDLAMSLNNLGNGLSELGRREEALQAAEEATGIFWQLAAQRPDAFLPDLAMSLNNLGNRLSELGRREEALQAAEEAVRIRRQLAAQRPDAFLPDLATSLCARGRILAANADPSTALASFHEGIELLKPLFLRLPQAHRRLMGMLVLDYIKACKTTATEPDIALLADILGLLLIAPES